MGKSSVFYNIISKMTYLNFSKREYMYYLVIVLNLLPREFYKSSFHGHYCKRVKESKKPDLFAVLDEENRTNITLIIESAEDPAIDASIQ